MDIPQEAKLVSSSNQVGHAKPVFNTFPMLLNIKAANINHANSILFALNYILLNMSNIGLNEMIQTMHNPNSQLLIIQGNHETVKALFNFISNNESIYPSISNITKKQKTWKKKIKFTVHKHSVFQPK